MKGQPDYLFFFFVTMNARNPAVVFYLYDIEKVITKHAVFVFWKESGILLRHSEVILNSFQFTCVQTGQK